MERPNTENVIQNHEVERTIMISTHEEKTLQINEFVHLLDNDTEDRRICFDRGRSPKVTHTDKC